MAIEFQPKVIIGSVCGIIASVVGFVAIFFPSLFNLETKKMNELSITINNIEDTKKLYEFLKVNENRIVRLEINYKESVGKNTADNTDLIFSPESDLKGNCYAELISPKLSHVRSDFQGDIMGRSFFRENGGFGFWEKNPKTTLENDLDYAYQLAIPYKSEGNSLYKWNLTEPEYYSEMNTFKIAGVFLVSQEVDEDKYGKNAGFMLEKYYEEKCWSLGVDFCIGPKVIELQPLSKKEIELRNY